MTTTGFEQVWLRGSVPYGDRTGSAWRQTTVTRRPQLPPFVRALVEVGRRAVIDLEAARPPQPTFPPRHQVEREECFKRVGGPESPSAFP